MPTAVEVDQVRTLIEEGAQIVEALPEENFTEAHLPSAINLPLKRLTAATAAVLDRERAVVVYCWDSL